MTLQVRLARYPCFIELNGGVVSERWNGKDFSMWSWRNGGGIPAFILTVLRQQWKAFRIQVYSFTTAPTCTDCVSSTNRSPYSQYPYPEPDESSPRPRTRFLTYEWVSNAERVAINKCWQDRVWIRIITDTHHKKGHWELVMAEMREGMRQVVHFWSSVSWQVILNRTITESKKKSAETA